MIRANELFVSLNRVEFQAEKEIHVEFQVKPNINKLN